MYIFVTFYRWKECQTVAFIVIDCLSSSLSASSLYPNNDEELRLACDPCHPLMSPVPDGHLIAAHPDIAHLASAIIKNKIMP